jgi:hypothetical protein
MRRALSIGLVGLVSCAESAPAPSHPDVRRVDDETVGCTLTPPIRTAPMEFDDTDASAVRLFYEVLAPYGSWRDDPRLGLVWTPSKGSIDESFVPYATNGRWTYREHPLANGDVAPDWTWVSDLAWGWVTFHYGRWTYAGTQGWTWVPGRRYAGAWVDWRVPEEAGGVIGWGPTPPSHLWRVRWRGPDVRNSLVSTIPYYAFATPYAYVQSNDVFARNPKLLVGASALSVAHATRPSDPPRASQLGVSSPPAPPAMDRGLQQAWMLATPASAAAVGAGPELGSPPHLRTWVAGSRRY